MTKSKILILIALIANGCLGQYPKLSIDSKGKVYNDNAQTNIDTLPANFNSRDDKDNMPYLFDTAINSLDDAPYYFYDSSGNSIILIEGDCGHPLPVTITIDTIPNDTLYEAIPFRFFLLDTPISHIEFYSGSSDSPFVALSINKKDTVITVVGDSLNAIKSLFNVWADKQKEIKYLKDAIEIYKEMLDQMFDDILQPQKTKPLKQYL